MSMISIFPAMDVGTTDKRLRYTVYMKPRHLLLSALLMTLSWAGLSSPALADDDHLEARRLMESGAVLPLQTILDRLRLDYPGRILEVELEKEHGIIIYEIEIVDDDGKVRELSVNASTGELLQVKEDD